MIWLIVDATGYPVDCFDSEAFAREALAKRQEVNPELRLLRMFVQSRRSAAALLAERLELLDRLEREEDGKSGN
jgi:hypothetical protein